MTHGQYLYTVNTVISRDVYGDLIIIYPKPYSIYLGLEAEPRKCLDGIRSRVWRVVPQMDIPLRLLPATHKWSFLQLAGFTTNGTVARRNARNQPYARIVSSPPPGHVKPDPALTTTLGGSPYS